MRYWNYRCYKGKTNKSKLKVSDWRATLTSKKGTLSFGEEIKIGGF